jgi:hypothetical protein
MIAHINLDDRLSILRVGDPSKSWNSLDDQRVCALCERKFKGRQVDIRRLPRGKLKLCCPTLGCASTIQQWRYADRPFPLIELKPIGDTMGLTKRNGARLDQRCEFRLVTHDWGHS